MAETRIRIENPPVVLRTRPALEMDEEQFFEFCQLNRDWRIERSAEGDLEVMAPTGGETSNRNFKLSVQLGIWTDRDGTGVAFESSGRFRPAQRRDTLARRLLGAQRTAGEAYPAEQKKRFLPLCPDFVIELRSPTDPLAPIEAKMREYMENGARLGWLIDPVERRVHVYKPGEPVEILEKPDALSGGPVLPGFVLDLEPIWEPGL